MGVRLRRRGQADRVPGACVLGDIDIVRTLALAGIRSTVFARRDNPVRFSRSVETAVAWRAPRSDPDARVEQMLEFARTLPQPPVLYYDADWDLLLVSQHRERLRPAFRFVIAEAELVESLVDKALFQALAERLGLPVPRGRHLPADGAAPDATDLRFPLLAKPLIREHATWRPVSRAKAVAVDTPAALRALCERMAGGEVDMLVQEAIPGPESRIESYHVYVDELGRIAGEFTGRKLRTHPPGYGYSTAVTITRTDDVAALGREIVSRLDLRGVAKLDFKRAPDGRLHLLEVNPRFSLWHHPGALAGVNLPAMVYRDLMGLDRPPPARARAGVSWCSLAHDWQAARAQGIGLGRWLGWTLACEAKSGFAWDDPLPLPRAALSRLRTRLAG
jgi:D-aspartate ligase